MAPHLTHSHPVRRLAAGALMIATMAMLAACLSPEQEAVQREMNADRHAHGRSSLIEHWQAQAKAQKWAEKLARDRRLSHSNLTDGITVRWCSLGENVGYGPSVASIEDAYMASSGHRANILDTKWNGVGVGFAKNGSTVYTVQFFIKTC